MAKPLKVWSGSEWVEVAAQLVNTDDFLSNEAASANYLNIFDAASTYATLISASLTGIPTAPTAASGNNTNQLATTSFVRTEITNLIDSAPSALDTLNELAAALGDDANFASSTASAIGQRLLASTASTLYMSIGSTANHATSASSINWAGVTGRPTTLSGYGITDAIPVSSSQSYLTRSDANIVYASLASASLTGTPIAPTAASGTNTQQIATTAFVRREVSNLIASAPATLDTLNELATALGNDPNFATTITNSIATKLDAATASTLYLPISASSNYLFASTASAIYLRQDSASATYASSSLLSATINNEELLIIAGAL